MARSDESTATPESMRPLAAKVPALSRLLIVRHGETAWNVEGRMQGQTDVSLNDHGRSQARKVAAALRQRAVNGADAVVSSDLSRASETADTIARAYPNAKRVVDPGLREINGGELQGKLLCEVDAVSARVARSWSTGELDKAYPGGESGTAAIERGLESLRQAAELGPTVVVVTHGGLMKWTAIGIELLAAKSAQRVDVEELFSGSSSSDEDKKWRAKTMRTPRLTNVLQAAFPNCCCTTLLYDRETRVFKPERWFEVLIDEDALGDNG